ncbi:MAG: DUF2628 domain-containing protein [Alphaproteobacteria bacterium]
MSVPSVEGPRRPPPAPPSAPVGPATEEDDLRAAIGPNAESFLAYLAKTRAGGGSGIAWCWPSFFLGAIWFFYRKLYRIGSLYVASIILPTLILPPPVPDLVMLAVWLASALFAKKVYMDAVFRRIADADARGLTGEARRHWLAQSGGTSPGAAIALVVAVVLLTVVAGQYVEMPAE